MVGMALIIEDGTVIAGANSFATVEEARAYTEARGVELPLDDAEVEHALVKAGDYLISYEQKLKGQRVQQAQTMVYPRFGVILYDTQFPSTGIPQQLKDAQIELATYAADGVVLRPVGAGRETRREEVGPIKLEYFEGGRSSIDPVFNAANDILKPLLSSAGGNFFPVYRA
jgi:hypothetical protein